MLKTFLQFCYFRILKHLMDYKIGDIVKLKSDTVKMTVYEFPINKMTGKTKEDWISCIYRDNNLEPQYRDFPVAAIEVVK